MKISVPKNWKVIRRGFLYIEWQHGQKNITTNSSGQPRQDGWKWTSKIRILLRYDIDIERWQATLYQPYHPTQTLGGRVLLKSALDIVTNEMERINALHLEEE